MANLKNKSVLVIDYGLCLEIALKFAEKFGKVYYWTSWQSAFPSSENSMIGEGFEGEGVYKIKYFWDYVDKVDLICAFDVYFSDVIEFLRSGGYRVFGAGLAEYLETNKIYGRQIQKSVGLPTQETFIVHGLTQLKNLLKQETNLFVKLNTFRGDIETFFSKDWDSAKIYVDKLAVQLGARQDRVDFMVERHIEGVEPGIDTFVVDGKYPELVLWGYEKKGSGYICKVENYKNVPVQIKNINDRLSSYFEKFKSRSFFSTELIATETEGYLIDYTMRSPMPVPTSIMLEIFDNIPEFIWAASNGELIDLIPKYKYGCGVALDSEWAEKNWLEIELDENICPRNRIKFRRVLKDKNKYFVVPGLTSICSVIGLGNSVDEAVEELKKNIKGVSGFQLDSDVGGIYNTIQEAIEGQQKYNLNFFDKEE